MGKPTDLVQGTLDLLILKTLSLEPAHGWAIAKTHPADLERRAAGAAGFALPGAASPRAARLDHGDVGRDRDRPRGQGLRADARRPHAARARARELERLSSAVNLGRARRICSEGAAMRLLDRAVACACARSSSGSQVEQDLDDELRFHVEAHVDELSRTGMSPEHAAPPRCARSAASSRSRNPCATPGTSARSAI